MPHIFIECVVASHIWNMFEDLFPESDVISIDALSDMAFHMGRPMCIHGYSREYPKKIDKLFILYDRAINLASVCIEIHPIIRTSR
jgi:hypothetical protein